ncbi:MAG: hypothetical protein FWF53_06505 [Candidatus Azobacteroides sp.]|nr:hypothetical protein [Candidatus Azobacteroides sp.]
MIIAVDFDGTIVEHAYPKIGKPIPFAIDVLRKLQNEEHHLLVLWTVREGRLLDEAVNYCSKNGITFYAVNKNYPEEEPGDTSRKLTADIFIDDKNIGGLPDWGIIYKAILSGNNDFRNIDDYISDNNMPKKKKNLFIRIGEAWETAQKYK